MYLEDFVVNLLRIVIVSHHGRVIPNDGGDLPVVTTGLCASYLLLHVVRILLLLRMLISCGAV